MVLPLYTSHYNMSDAELQRAGVKPGSVRVSIGVEDAEDLIADLRQALGVSAPEIAATKTAQNTKKSGAPERAAHNGDFVKWD